MKNVVLLNNGHEIAPGSTINAKNMAVAEKIAGILGDAIVGGDANTGEQYHIPFEAVDAADAHHRGITGSDDLYGGIVRRPEQADKALLHVPVSRSEPYPDWYSPDFAREVSGAVLPGFTVFDREGARTAYRRLAVEGLTARLKDPAERSERGQFSVRTPEELEEALSQYRQGIGKSGLVVEADLDSADTISVGYVALGGEDYCWYGKTWDVEYGGKKKFGGNELTVVRGGFADLREQSIDSQHRLAVQQTGKVVEAYPACGAVISRATFDVVQGYAANGEFLSGVTDPSIRPSASSPAEVHAIQEFQAHPDASAITARVTYDYGHQMGATDERELFASSHKARIFVETVDMA
jgi:hypothetical protein